MGAEPTRLKERDVDDGSLPVSATAVSPEIITAHYGIKWAVVTLVQDYKGSSPIPVLLLCVIYGLMIVDQECFNIGEASLRKSKSILEKDVAVAHLFVAPVIVEPLTNVSVDSVIHCPTIGFSNVQQ